MNKTWNYFSISLNINSFDLKDNNMDNPPLASPEKKKTITDKVLERIIDIAVPTLCLLICWIYFPPRLSFLTDSFRPEPRRPSSSRPVWIVFHPWVASSPVAAAEAAVSLRINVTIRNWAVPVPRSGRNAGLLLSRLYFPTTATGHEINHTKESQGRRGEKSKEAGGGGAAGLQRERNLRSDCHPREEASFHQKAPSKDSAECLVSLWCLPVMRNKPWWQ